MPGGRRGGGQEPTHPRGLAAALMAGVTVLIVLLAWLAAANPW